MKKNLCIELIQQLSQAEQQLLVHYLKSPDRKTRYEVKKLASIVCNRKLEYSPELIFQQVYPQRPFQKQTLNQLMSWLYRDTLSFLKTQLEENQDLLLVKELHRRGLTRQRDRLIKQIQKKLDQSTANSHDYEEVFRLEQLRYQIEFAGKRTEENNLQVINDNLDYAFLVKKLQQACTMKGHENVSQSRYDFGLLPLIIKHLEDRKLYELPKIGAYYYAFQFIAEPERATAYQLFEHIIKQKDSYFSTSELRDLYLLAINYCIRQLNQGDIAMAKKALSWYQSGLSKNVLLVDGRISSFTYRNAVALGLKIKEYSWTENFILEQAEKLVPAERENLVQFNLAKLAYARGLKEKALEELRYVNSKDSLFSLNLNTLRAKVYFEIEAFELLEAHLDKMRIFLRRKDTSYHHKNYLNFIKYCRKLLRLPPGHRNDQRLALLQEIKNESILTEKDWLLAQLSSKV